MDLIRPRAMNRLHERGFKPCGLIDIGPGDGAWTVAARKLYPKTSILIVERNPGWALRKATRYVGAEWHTGDEPLDALRWGGVPLFIKIGVPNAAAILAGASWTLSRTEVVQFDDAPADTVDWLEDAGFQPFDGLYVRRGSALL